MAITAIAVDVGKMDAATAAALVGAGILSTLIFPLLALRLRGDRPGPPGRPDRRRGMMWGGCPAS